MAKIVAEAPRLILRTWEDDDRAAYLATCNTLAVTEYLGGPASEGDIDAALGRLRASQAEHGFCFWVVERRDDRELLGYCGLKICSDVGTRVERATEIGWRLREDAWGLGFAREAAAATLVWAWRNLVVPRVIAMTVPANRASWGLMERIGMQRRPELDFDHARFDAGHPLSRHIVYAIDRPQHD